MTEKKLTAEPGKALITFTTPYTGYDFGPECAYFKAGDTLEIDADLAKRLEREYGGGCPFEIGASNKAIGKAPTTK